MGLLGTSLLVNHKLNDRFTLYSGLGIYSAISGDRGGFFTGGLDVGAKLQIEKWIFGTGFFVGGGGGGAAPQGGGLMLRPYFSMLRDFRKLKGGFFFSKVKFPNGEIDSEQLGIQVELPFQIFIADMTGFDMADRNFVLKKSYIAPALLWYSPRKDVKIRSGSALADDMALVGIEMGRVVRPNMFLFGEAAGAYRGESDGYAEWLGGLGIVRPLGDRFILRAKVAIGSGGGGNVDTGGGLLYKVTAGGAFMSAPHLYLAVDYGGVDAPDGRFRATMLKAALHYRRAFASLSPRGKRLDPSKLAFGRWRIRLAATRYLASNSLRKSGVKDDPIDLFGIKFDRFFSEYLYLTGQAGAAYRGEAGGYATGLFGLGAIYRLTDRFSFQAEALAGAGGGGGIATDGGRIVQAMAGGNHRFSKHGGLQILVGRVFALKGALDTTVFEIAWVRRFNTIESMN